MADFPAPPPAGAPLGELLDRLADDAEIIGWAEGVHLRREYLAIRDVVIRHLVESRRVGILAAETNFARSRATDAYVCGHGPDEPSREALVGVWSWARGPLQANRALLKWLRGVNADRGEHDKVRFYGLEMYGHGPTDDAELAGMMLAPDDRRHAARLLCRLTEHRGAGGDHRDPGGRDGAQYDTLVEVRRRHRGLGVLLFEQNDHLDRRVSQSLGQHLGRGEIGRFRAVGALWRDSDPGVGYALGPYAALSRWLTEHRNMLCPTPIADTGVLDLRAAIGVEHPILDDARTRFDAILYAHSLTAVGPAR